MKVGVCGLWHLGVVYSVGMTRLGHQVVAYDQDSSTVHKLNNAQLPVFEPDLTEILEDSIRRQSIKFTDSIQDLQDLDILVIAYDTPIDEDGDANYKSVIAHFEKIAQSLRKNTVIMISSQLPIGSGDVISKIAISHGLLGKIVVQPENLRLGKSLESFFQPERIVVGTPDGKEDETIIQLFQELKKPILWVHRKSAEMIKHALNSYLALNITFMGEIAEICEQHGGDAKEVEIGLRTDSRVGPNAYLSPGLGFSGTTLARELKILSEHQSEERPVPTLLQTVLISNDYNNMWLDRELNKILKKQQKTLKICFWGVTYVNNTDTLRGSNIYQLMQKLSKEGHEISYVESVELGSEFSFKFKRNSSPEESLDESDLIVVYKKIFNNSKEIDIKKVLKNSS
jgi:UDPglucose 6-dehydrogenase